MAKTRVLINSTSGENISYIEIEDFSNISKWLDVLKDGRKYHSGEYFEFVNYISPFAEELGVSFPDVKEVVLEEK
jgi:hypothetical protein